MDLKKNKKRIDKAHTLAKLLAEKMLNLVEKKVGVISPLTDSGDGKYIMRFNAIDCGQKVKAGILLEIQLPSDNEWYMGLASKEEEGDDT